MSRRYYSRNNIPHKKHSQKSHHFNKPQKTSPSNSKNIVLDTNLVLDFVDYLVSKGAISKEDLLHEVIREDQPLNNTELKVVEDGRIINAGQKIDKGALRELWLEQMKNHSLYCCLCGQPITTTNGGSPWRLTAEHTRPRSKGGKSDSTNLLPAHSVCNGLKTNMMPQTWAKVGYNILTNRGIKVDMSHVSYKYIIEHRRQYSR